MVACEIKCDCKITASSWTRLPSRWKWQYSGQSKLFERRYLGYDVINECRDWWSGKHNESVAYGCGTVQGNGGLPGTRTSGIPSPPP